MPSSAASCTLWLFSRHSGSSVSSVCFLARLCMCAVRGVVCLSVCRSLCVYDTLCGEASFLCIKACFCVFVSRPVVCVLGGGSRGEGLRGAHRELGDRALNHCGGHCVACIRARMHTHMGARGVVHKRRTLGVACVRRKRVNARVHVHMCVCVCVCVYMYIYTYIYTYIYMYIHVYTCINMYPASCSRVHLGIWGVRTGGMRQRRAGRQLRLQHHVVRACGPVLLTFTNTCTCACMLCVYIHIHLLVCVHACMYACMRARKHTHTHTNTLARV